MANNTMTKRAFYEAVAAGKISDEVKSFAVDLLAKLDSDAQKRKTGKAAQEKAAARTALNERVLSALSVGLENAMTGEEVANAVGASKGEVVYALTALAKSGKIERDDVKRTAVNAAGKSVTKKTTGYYLPKTAETPDETDDETDDETGDDFDDETGDDFSED